MDALGNEDARKTQSMKNGDDWHLQRPSTAERMGTLNESCGFIPEDRTLASVLRGFHYRGDRAEVRRGWHVSKEWKKKYVPKLPWKVGAQPFDPNVDVKHLRKVKGAAAKKYEAAMRNEENDEESDEEVLDEFMFDGDSESGRLGNIAEDEESDGYYEDEVHEDLSTADAESRQNDKLEPVPLEEAGTFAWRSGDGDSGNWHDVTGRRMLKHDGDGRLNQPGLRPPTACSFGSQVTDHQHDNLLNFLVDDRFFKGKEPMQTKRAVKDSILHRIPTKAVRRSRSAMANVPAVNPTGKLTNDGAAKLSEERRRMEQNRVLRHVTEEEFQRETERRMMLATIANPQKRLMLHRYFEEQRSIATKKIEALVRAQEHAMLTDMKLTSGPDLRGPNFEKTYEPPDYFPSN